MTVAPLVELDGVGVTHVDAERPTPCDVSSRIGPGEVALLLGPSGCGKSSLAMTLNGLVPHSVDAELSGRVLIDGIDTAGSSPARLSTAVAMVFQDPDAQLVTGSVLDEVAFALENLRLPVDEVLRRSELALRDVGLWQRRDDDPSTLSGGGRQRLAIACALAMRPRLLVLDEPTSNLDPAGTADVYAALGMLARTGRADAVGQAHSDGARNDRGDAADRARPSSSGDGPSPADGNAGHHPSAPAILLVEHDVDAALPLATRVLVLDHDGRLVFDGTPDEVLRDHSDDLRALGVWLPTPGRPAPCPSARISATPSPSAHAALAPALPASGSRAPAEGTMRPAIAAHRLSVVRGRGRASRTVLHDVSLDIPRGSFTAIVGQNGAGKSTLAQALAGVVPPPRGTVRITVDAAAADSKSDAPASIALDAATASPRELARHVGYVFQNPEHQFVAHTVRDELGYGLRHIPPSEREARVDAMLDRFGLGELADRHPFRLSGGQKRRLSVGTALIAGADRPGGVLVLDEPTFGQDHARADELLALLDELHRHGTTIVVVTHDLGLVAGHATHVAALSGGRLRAFGAADEVWPLLETDGFWRADEREQAVPERRPGLGPPVGPDDRSRHARQRRIAPLQRIDPLALMAAVLPAMIGLVFTRDIATPALAIAASYLALIAGAPRTRTLASWLGIVLPVMAIAVGAGFALWSDPATGAATGLRLTSLLALALIPGLAMHGPDFVRSLVTHLRIPYRIGHTALAAYRFVPRMRRELEVIRAAHRVRGSGGTPISRGFGSVLPLLAGAIRHAERVALSMDARAFGAHPTRTERHPARWHVRDTITVTAGLTATAALFFVGRALGG